MSQAAYCGKDEYLKHVWTGPLTGFVATAVLYNEKHDTEGFVGYLPSDHSVHVSFRGSSSMANWMSDLNATKSDYSDPDCHKCEVHDGFWTAEQSVLTELFAAVADVALIYGTRSVKTTGHSLGAALAQLAAMDLQKAGYSVSMINFGQPRVGNRYYADLSALKLPNQYRVTHHKDLVPHVPVELMGFRHSTTEVYEDKDGIIKVCSATEGEDKHCSDKFPFPAYGPLDHMVYLGTVMSGGQFANCQSNDLPMNLDLIEGADTGFLA